MQDDAAYQLHIEVPHVEVAPARLADDGERLRQQVVERSPLGDPFLKSDRLGGKVDIGQRFELGTKGVDGSQDRLHDLDFTLVFRAKDFGQDGVNHENLNTVGEPPTIILPCNV